jgi:DNA-binding transcriptional LysR family regulator
MELNHLKTFIDAAQTLNFSETAQRLHTTQPTVSKHVKELENEVGVDLFERVSGGKLKLSQAGQALLPWAQQLLRECNKFHEIAHSMNEKVTGTLSISCATASGKYLLPVLAARFRTRFPDVQIKLRPCAPTQVSQDLLNHETDLGIVSFESQQEGLECQQFTIDDVILIAPAHHPWARRAFIEPDDLLREPILLREPDSGTRRALASALAAHDISLNDLLVLLEIGNAEGMVHTVAAGVGVAFAPRVATELAIRAGAVREITVKGLRIERKIYMLRNALRAPSRPAELFWGCIHDPENADLFYRKTGER